MNARRKEFDEKDYDNWLDEVYGDAYGNDLDIPFSFESFDEAAGKLVINILNPYTIQPMYKGVKRY